RSVNRNTWKSAEVEWAEALGGVRVPITGRARGSAPDVAHDLYAIEIKKVSREAKRNPYLTSALLDAYDQAVKAGEHSFREDGKARIPLVGLERTNDSRRIERFVLLSRADFLELTSLEDR